MQKHIDLDCEGRLLLLFLLDFLILCITMTFFLLGLQASAYARGRKAGCLVPQQCGRGRLSMESTSQTTPRASRLRSMEALSDCY